MPAGVDEGAGDRGAGAMTSFMQRSVKNWLIIKAAKEIRKEIEKAGLDNLKTLANNGISIVKTYFNGCSPQEKAVYKQDLNTLLQMGVTPDMIETELIRQMPELAPVIESKPGYKKSEIKNLEQFLREG